MFRALSHDSCDCDLGEGAVAYTMGRRRCVVAGGTDGVLYAIILLTPGKNPQLVRSIALARAAALGRD